MVTLVAAPAGVSSHDLGLGAWLAGPPTAAAQQAVVHSLVALAWPLVEAHALPRPFRCIASPRLRRRYGQCRHFADGQPPLISLRCTADDDAHRWRTPAAMLATLLHELAHLRHRRHSRAFWQLVRRLLDDAARRGLYVPAHADLAERAQGTSKLAGSAADALARAARARRRDRARAHRELVARWPVGSRARVPSGRGELAQASVRVLQQRRTRLLVETPSGRHYLVPAPLLSPVEADGLPGC